MELHLYSSRRSSVEASQSEREYDAELMVEEEKNRSCDHVYLGKGEETLWIGSASKAADLNSAHQRPDLVPICTIVKFNVTKNESFYCEF